MCRVDVKSFLSVLLRWESYRLVFLTAQRHSFGQSMTLCLYLCQPDSAIIQFQYTFRLCWLRPGCWYKQKHREHLNWHDPCSLRYRVWRLIFNSSFSAPLSPWEYIKWFWVFLRNCIIYYILVLFQSRGLSALPTFLVNSFMYWNV